MSLSIEYKGQEIANYTDAVAKKIAAGNFYFEDDLLLKFSESGPSNTISSILPYIEDTGLTINQSGTTNKLTVSLPKSYESNNSYFLLFAEADYTSQSGVNIVYMRYEPADNTWRIMGQRSYCSNPYNFTSFVVERTYGTFSDNEESVVLTITGLSAYHLNVVQAAYGTYVRFHVFKLNIPAS